MLRGVPDLHVRKPDVLGLRRDQAPRAEARAPRAGRHLARDRRGALPAVPGLRRRSETRSSSGSRASIAQRRTRSTRTCGRSRSTSRSRSAGSRTTSSTSRTSAARAATRGRVRASCRPRLRVGGCVARTTSGRPGMAARGWVWTAYDWDEGRLFNYSATPRTRSRCGTRRRSSRSTCTSTRTSSTTDRSSGLHRGVLQEPRLGRRERLGRLVRDSHVVAPMVEALAIVGGYLLGSLPFGYWLPLVVHREDIRSLGKREHRRLERLPRLRPAARHRRSPCSTWGRASQPGCSGSGRRSSRRRARRRRRHARPRPSGLPRLPERREDGRHGRRRDARARATRAPLLRRPLDRRASSLTRYASVASLVTAVALPRAASRSWATPGP